MTSIIISDFYMLDGRNEHMDSPTGVKQMTEAARANEAGPRIYYHGHAHPIGESMYLEPPDGVRFVANRSPSAFEGFSVPPAYRPMRRLAVDVLGRFFGTIGSPRRVPILARCDLVHVDGAVIPITTRPWVVGCVEYASAFFGFDDTWFRRSIPRRSLLRLLSGQKCRKILTQSEAALSSIRVGYGRDFAAIESKCAVLPPAIPSKYLLRTPPKREEDGKVRILFVGNHFFDKGGRELFYTFRRLRKKFDVELVLVTSVPKHHEHYFASFSKTVAAEPGVRLLSKVPKDVLWKEYYAKSDVFCMPSYMDTFGYVALEAMANRLPVVTTDMFALQEIVKDGETGLKVHAPIASFERDRPRTPESLRRYREAVLDESLFTSVVDDLEIALTRLIEDGSVRRRMGESAYREVEHGRFSVPYRNGRLMDHYREALG